MNELKDYILVLEDIIPDKLCDNILSEYKESNEWSDTLIGNGVVNKKIRNCYSLPLSNKDIIGKNNFRKNLDDNIFECASNSIKKYNEQFSKAHITKDSGYNLLKYEKGGFYTEHCDSFSAIPRTISCSFILNDDFKGGQFSFFKNKLIYSLKKRSVIMFPSNFMYPHSILPVTEGTRYSIVTWFL